MAIDDKTRTELEAAAFRRLVEHLRSRTDVQNIDLMNLAGFCRNCLSNWLKEEADAKGVAMTKDESREAVYGMPYETWKSDLSGHRQPRATRCDEEGPERALIRLQPDPYRHSRHSQVPIAALHQSCSAVAFSCGRAVDERDVALTQGAPLLRVISGCGA